MTDFTSHITTYSDSELTTLKGDFAPGAYAYFNTKLTAEDSTTSTNVEWNVYDSSNVYVVSLLNTTYSFESNVITDTTSTINSGTPIRWDTTAVSDGEYWHKVLLTGGGITDSISFGSNFTINTTSGDTPIVLSNLLFNPIQPTTNQDCDVTITYRDSDNEAPTLSEIAMTDEAGDVSLYQLTTTATDYRAGIQYTATLPAGDYPTGSVLGTCTFVNANDSATSDGSIVVTAESVLVTAYDEVDIIVNLLENKGTPNGNYMLIKNRHGLGVLKAKDILNYLPATYHESLPSIWVQLISSTEPQDKMSQQCESLEDMNLNIVFDIYVTVNERVKITYNSGDYKGRTALSLISWIVQSIMFENKDYTKSDNSVFRMFDNTLIDKDYVPKEEIKEIAKDGMAYRMRYTARIRITNEEG